MEMIKVSRIDFLDDDLTQLFNLIEVFPTNKNGKNVLGTFLETIQTMQQSNNIVHGCTIPAFFIKNAIEKKNRIKQSMISISHALYFPFVHPRKMSIQQSAYIVLREIEIANFGQASPLFKVQTHFKTPVPNSIVILCVEKHVDAFKISIRGVRKPPHLFMWCAAVPSRVYVFADKHVYSLKMSK